MFKSFMPIVQWISSRVMVIYVILFLFCLLCVDFKMLEMRIKTRHLNDAIPDFAQMIMFNNGQDLRSSVNWKPYEKYFKLILSYLPNDTITKQLLGFVEFNTGHEQKAIELFKSSASIEDHALFWPNYNLGVLYYKKGMWPQSAEYLLKAISSNPQLALLLMQDSIVYKQIFASPYFKSSLSDGINEAQSRGYILLLSDFYNMRQYDKMLIIFKLAIANRNLSYQDAFYYYAGLAFLEEGQVDRAFLLFQKSLSIEKNNPDVYYYMADICQKAGQLEQARDYLEISYALHQKNDPRFPYESHVNLRFF